MPNNDDQLQQQYQEILDKYASSLTPPAKEPEPATVPEPEFTAPPTPLIEPLTENITPPIYFPPQPVVDKPSNFFKYLFYLSLFIFIIVACAVFYNVLSSQSVSTANVPTSAPMPTSNLANVCEVGGNKYEIGQSLPSADSCNTCSCTPNLTVVCTEKACVSPTPTVKPVTKIYKDTKYGYQFECPVTSKYVVEVTSVNGNKIPYKQETCTTGDSVTTISVYDNTVVHDFGNIQTQISPNKKYVVTLEGDDSITTSFKFLQQI